MNIASYQLQEENLIPFYIIDDRLKQNVQKNNQFFTDCINYQQQMKNQINEVRLSQQKLQRQTNEKLIYIEKKIYKDISAELEGRIAIILGKRMAGIIQASQKREAAMNSLQANIDGKIAKISKTLKYEISQDNQKFFLKQIKKVKQSGGLSNFETVGNSGIGTSIATEFQTSSFQGIKKQQRIKQIQQRRQQGTLQNNWQEGHRMVKQLQDRIGKIEQFNIGFDKRFYDSMNALKESWKQLGGELLDNKKSVNKKLEDLKIELIKVKNTKDFANTPQKAEESFKQKLTQKFTDIYQLLAESVNKHQFQSNIDALTKKVQRHNDELSDIRQQLSENSQFFTFYMNNADNDDLKGEIIQISQVIANNKSNFEEELKKIKQENEKQEIKIEKLRKLIEDLKQVEVAMDARVTNVNTTIDQMINRIDELQDYNKFGPEKLNKITNVLDNDMTVEQRQLVQRKPSISVQPQNTNQALAREFRGQISKLKDQIFVLNTLSKDKQNQLAQSKKMIANLQLKIDRIKFEAEEAVVSRKPWICLSCDKQQKQTKKQSKQKKIEPIRAGGYGGLNGPLGRVSEKNIGSSKSIHAPPFQEKFQVYEKFREKYLSDTVKLPDIYKQKIGDKGQKDSSKIHQ